MVAVLHPRESGPKRGEIESLAAREPFSKYLPYLAYDEATRLYYNTDDTYGLAWECRPLAFVGPKALESLASMLRQEQPAGTAITFTLFPDDDVEPMLAQYLRLKTRQNRLVQESAQHYVDFLRQGTRGIATMSGVPVRQFRLFVSVKSATRPGDDRIKAYEEALTQASLAPVALKPGVLLDFLRRALNSESPANADAYDPTRLLRDQVIQAETVVRHAGDHMRLGSRYAACLTPKSLPTSEFLDVLSMNRVLGGYGGPQEDGTQLTTKFVWSTTVFYKTEPSEIRRKASLMMAQRAGGSIAKEIGRRVQELSWVLDDLEQNPYCDVISAIWVFGEDEEALNRGVARARSLWEGQRFVMQRETRIAPAMLIATLPFGLYLGGKNIEVLNRHFTVSAAAAAHLLPVQGDFAGRMAPVMLFVGRKGQLVSVDVFDKGANNQNFLVCASSGAGKSFTASVLVSDYYGSGSLMRMIDIGYSYEKACMLAKGRYIDVGRESERICLNPFHTTAREGDDLERDEVTTCSVLLSMIYSSTDTKAATETHYSIVKEAIRWAKARDGGERGIDHVEEYLRTYPKYAGERVFEGAQQIAREMAFNLHDFTTKGRFGRMFNGTSTLNIASDEFVVLELEQIMNDPELFQVIAMQAINAITQDLYLSDRSQRRFILFDEAWKYLSGGSSVGATMIANIIKEGYRRARKYSGSIGTVFQSALDLPNFGEAGVVIKSNSAFKFFLESQDYENAVRQGVLDYQGLLLDLAKSVRNARPRYSEILFDTPFGAGIGRLCVDRYTYWRNTTTGHEVARFKKELELRKDPAEAIAALVAEENRR
jgi:conjugal transfer ATP-binding protein TraC